MKTQSLRTVGTHNTRKRSVPGTRPPNERRIPHMTTLRNLPVVSHRRYPSLSDDNQPPMFSARLVAIMAIVAILLALSTGA